MKRVLRTMLTSSSSKSCLTRVSFHLFDAGLIRWSTVKVRSTMASCLYLGALGTLSIIQQSVYTFVFAPLPSLWSNPFLRSSRPCWMLRQAYEGLVPIQHSKKNDRGKYLCCNIQAKRESRCFHNLQACFASNAWLNFSMSLNPSPLNSLSLHNFCQAIHDIFFLLVPLLHQNSIIALVSLAQRSFVIW